MQQIQYDCLCGQSNYLPSSSISRQSCIYYRCHSCSYPFGCNCIELLNRCVRLNLCILCPHCRSDLCDNLNSLSSQIVRNVASFACLNCLCVIPVDSLNSMSHFPCRHMQRNYLPTEDLPVWVCCKCSYYSICKDAVVYCFCESRYSLEHTLTITEVPCDDRPAVSVICRNCHVNTSFPKCDPYLSLLSSGSWGKVLKTHKVTSLKQLFPGDHIILRRPAYDHHAIISLVDISNNTFSIIHYSADSLDSFSGTWSENSSSSMSNVEVPKVIETSDILLTNVEAVLLKLIYLPSDCFPSHIVIQTAMLRLSETSYNILMQNCEHFVRQCKVGCSDSRQLERLWRGVAQSSSSVINMLLSRSTHPIAGSLSAFFMQQRRPENHNLAVNTQRQMLRNSLVLALSMGSSFLPLRFAILAAVCASSIDHFLNGDDVDP